MKVRKVFGTETTDYLDGFQYVNSALKFFPTAEGYFNVETGKYVYNYTDHLGNIRLSYAKNGAGTEIIEESNYYPFGLKHEGYNGLTGNPAYNYKYNGKELQETGMYDYGARMYMPDLGRWGVVDPLAEKMTRHSPYNYAFNNPLRFIDPDGRQVTDWYQNTLTGDYKWFDGKDQHEGYAYVDNSGTSDINILTRGGYENEVLGAVLHPDGTVSDYNYPNISANRGEILTTPDGTKFEAGSANIGTYWSFSANYAIGGGVGFSFGRVTDSKGETNWFSSFNGNIGFGASGGVEKGVIVPTDPNHKFVNSDFAGTGVAYSGGEGPLNVSYGGTFNDKYDGYRNVDNFNPSHFGQNSKTNNSGYKTLGIGIAKGSAQALPIMWTKSKTHVYGQ